MINERLKEERERLTLTQPAFAAQAGTKKNTIINWEKGTSSPTAVQLSALAEIGLDVLYVLTGQRVAAVESSLKPDEAALLDNYRHSPKDQQAILKATSDAFAQHDCAVRKSL